MKTKVIQGHHYEPYPVLFERMTSWESKETLLPQIMGSGDTQGGGGKAKGTPNDPDSRTTEERRRKKEPET